MTAYHDHKRALFINLHAPAGGSGEPSKLPQAPNSGPGLDSQVRVPGVQLKKRFCLFFVAALGHETSARTSGIEFAQPFRQSERPKATFVSGVAERRRSLT